MLVRCDECGYEIKINLKKRKEKNNIEVQYFVCDNCKEEYITCCIDNYIKLKQKELNKLKNKDKKQKLLHDMKIHSDKLKKTICNK